MDACVGEFLHKFGSKIHKNNPKNNKVAVIVEPRKSYFLPLVIKNVMSVLNPETNETNETNDEWNLCVWTGELNSDWLTAVLTVSEGWEFTHKKIHSSNITTTQYSDLLKSREFWEAIEEEHILIFQTDTVLLRRPPNRMLEYPMIGAPCGDISSSHNKEPQNFIMNGGLSLRQKSAMIKVINFSRVTDEAEDIFFTKNLIKPPFAECAMFVENFVIDATTVIGIHGTDKMYLDPAVIEFLLKSVSF